MLHFFAGIETINSRLELTSLKPLKLIPKAVKKIQFKNKGLKIERQNFYNDHNKY